MTPNTEVLKPSEAAAFLGVSTDMLQRWRISGGGPAFITWGRRTVRYRMADLKAWVKAQPAATNTAEAAKMRASA